MSIRVVRLQHTQMLPVRNTDRDVIRVLDAQLARDAPNLVVLDGADVLVGGRHGEEAMQEGQLLLVAGPARELPRDQEIFHPAEEHALRFGDLDDQPGLFTWQQAFFRHDALDGGGFVFVGVLIDVRDPAQDVGEGREIARVIRFDRAERLHDGANPLNLGGLRVGSTPEAQEIQQRHGGNLTLFAAKRARGCRVINLPPMDAFLTADGLIAFATLTFLEVVLGVDNVIFISILVGKLPAAQQPRARTLGLAGAMGMRILLLLSLTWIMRLTQPLFTAFNHGFSGRDLILISGGLFLLWKATVEIHDKLEGEVGHGSAKVAPSFGAVIGQIMVLDIIFSLDSVITAVGMANDIAIMVTAVVVAVGIMMFSARAIGDFVMRHPTVKVLALSFLLMIGLALVSDGVGFHIPKGYIYFAMGFSIFVETINLRLRPAHAPVTLHEPYKEGKR
jgi:predicted tellurium resistance membrane protein TerC